jgi:hypothetical protein
MSLPAEIQIVAPDFDSIRDNLKRFLRNQTELLDYNFEGSSLSVILDLLAYDAYYHGWYANFAVNETFLQTAQIRNSVVAAARQVGYVPRSISSAIAIVDATVNSVNTADATITISKHSPFSTTIGSNTYTFYTISDYVTTVNNATSVTLSDIELYEGTKLTQRFTINAVSNTGTTLELLNENIDTRTISVSVAASNTSSTSVAYTRATSAVTVNATSNVYFLFETNKGTYDLHFGDGNLGRNLQIGQHVVVEYLVTRGKEGNGANTFSYGGNALGLLSQTSNVSISLSNVNVPAFGGADRESIDSIKFNAPNIYKTQGRIVTTTDARSVAIAEISGLDSVSVWGGEDNVPPTYGKIFLAMKPANADRYSPSQKSHIINTILKPKSLPIIRYEIVDPDYIYICVDTQVRYNSGYTNLSPELLRQLIASSIDRYAQDTLGQFGSYFRYSQLSGVIDNTDSSIQSNLTNIRLEKRLSINTATSSYTVNFSNPIYEPDSSSNIVSITSRTGLQFFAHVDETGLSRTGCYVENSGNTINVYRTSGAIEKLLTKENVGTIDFDSGVVEFTSFAPLNITTNFISELRLRAIPRDSDLVPTLNQIILLPPDNVSVLIVEDLYNRTTTTFGRVTAGGRRGAGSFS